MIFIREKKKFDRKLSKGRVKVENAFGLLKNRWRILRDMNVDIALAPTIVGACCMLHNFVQLCGEAEPSNQYGSRSAVGVQLCDMAHVMRRKGNIFLQSAIYVAD
ncbi:hypothetical protein L7F22_053746 [Adiantum nelumboides]|nr:hypothetical protein [Adiantum nelumboides]